MTKTDPEMAEVLRHARKACGWSLRRADSEFRTRYPSLRMSYMKISRYESGPIDRDRVDVPALVALCDLYGLDFEEVAPALRDEFRAICDLYGRVLEDEDPDATGSGDNLTPA